MSRNIVSVGSRAISGEVGKILAAGDINIVDANVQNLNGVGDINIVNSYVAVTKIAGDIIATNSKFGIVYVAGQFDCKDVCKVDTLIAIGELEAENLECRILRNFSKKSVQIHIRDYKKGSKLNINSGSKFKGHIIAETFENLCDFYLNFDYQFKNVLSIDNLHSEKVLECEELYSFGILDMEGVNADTIYIHPYTESRLHQVMGSDIRITEIFPMDQIFRMIPKSADLELYLKASVKPAGMMKLDSIEGDTIVLDHVQAKLVCGENVTIGDYCIIDRVEYKGSIQLSQKASVKEMIQV